METKQTTKTISLALGSGGARGLAHIGVIRRLLESGYDPGYIAGTSIGALIGGIFAAGKLDLYEEWARDLTRGDMLKLLDFSFRRGAIIKGDRVIDAICELIGDQDIEKLPIGFCAVATDMVEQSEVWLCRGSLFTAIRASTAIPTLMSPVRLQQRLLADGGLVNPIPIAPTLNHGANLTIAVDLNAKRERQPLATQAPSAAPAPRKESDNDSEPAKATGKYRKAIGDFVERLKPGKDNGEDIDEAPANQPGFLHMSTQTIEIMQNGIARLKLAAYKPDMVISLPRDLCQFWEFDRADEVIEVGYERAAIAIEEYEALRPDVTTDRTPSGD
ncbi:MAG: patatin-like phospholipase family protein [Pseudomonadota bacterium]